MQTTTRLLRFPFVLAAVIYSCFFVFTSRPAGSLTASAARRRCLPDGDVACPTASAALAGGCNKKKHERPQIMPAQRYKYILQWNNFFGDKNLGRGFKNLGCPRTDCVFTDNRSLLAVEDFDAVLFHMDGLQLDAPPALNEGKFPPRRSPHQRYIFFLLEAPPHTVGSSFKYMEGIFNWTMTYRLDSDFVQPYGRFFPLKGTPAPALGWLQAPAAPIAPSAAALDAHNYTDAPGEGEKALVAWLVSHCRTQSRREDYVRELSKLIRVDVYGKCGTLSWPKGPFTRRHLAALPSGRSGSGALV